MSQPPKKSSSNSLQFLLIFAAVYILSQLLLKTFFPGMFGGQTGEPGIYVRPQAAGIHEGNTAEILIENRTDTSFALPNRCPTMPPVDVFFVKDATGSGVLEPLTASGTTVPCEPPTIINPHKTLTYSLAPWKYSLLGRLGTYEVRIPEASSGGIVSQSGATVTHGTGAIASTSSARFTISEPGFFTKIFRALITKPLLNLLILIGSLVPGHNLGIAIIIVTIIVKLVLYIPTQKALQGQKEMQILQPKVEALKAKYKNDPAKLNEETMKLWKEHKVNPLQSCLPTLIQFPVLIGLFYTIRDGSNLALSRHLIYPFYQHLEWANFGTWFLGLDLLKPNIWILPLLLAVLQFLQMKLAFALNDRKKKKSDVIDIPSVKELEQEIKDAPKDPVSAQKLQQQMMLYGLPLMIGFFAIKFPAAVAIYWGVSTLFGIGQQLVVNRKTL